MSYLAALHAGVERQFDDALAGWADATGHRLSWGLERPSCDAESLPRDAFQVADDWNPAQALCGIRQLHSAHPDQPLAEGLLLLAEQDVRDLLRELGLSGADDTDSDSASLGELARDALAELGNLLLNACMAGLADRLQCRLQGSAPEVLTPFEDADAVASIDAGAPRHSADFIAAATCEWPLVLRTASGGRRPARLRLVLGAQALQALQGMKALPAPASSAPDPCAAEDTGGETGRETVTGTGTTPLPIPALRTWLDAFEDGAAVLDDQGGVQIVNRWLARRLGRPAYAAFSADAGALPRWLGAADDSALGRAVRLCLARGHALRLSRAFHSSLMPLPAKQATAHDEPGRPSSTGPDSSGPDSTRPDSTRSAQHLSVEVLPWTAGLQGSAPACLLRVHDLGDAVRHEAQRRSQSRLLAQALGRLTDWHRTLERALSDPRADAGRGSGSGSGRAPGAGIGLRAGEALYGGRPAVPVSEHPTNPAGLTGLITRARFEAALNAACRRSQEPSIERPGSSSPPPGVGLLWLQVDGPDSLRDIHGPEAADAALRELAVRLRRCMRPADVLARLEEQTFAVLVDEVPEAAVLVRLARQLQAAARQPLVLPGCHLLATVSVGWALSGPFLPGAAELMNAARAACSRDGARRPGPAAPRITTGY